MGVKLGKVISFNESEGYVPQPYPMYARSEAIGGAAEAPTVETGSQEITIMATVSYELD